MGSNCGCLNINLGIPQSNMAGYQWRFVKRVAATTNDASALPANASRVAAFLAINGGSAAAGGVGIGNTVNGSSRYFAFLNANGQPSVMLRTADLGTLLTDTVCVDNGSGDFGVDVWECVRVM